MKRVISLLFAIMFLLLSFAGCKKQTSAGKAFSYPVSNALSSLDPQIAGDDTALTVLSHAMEGLTRLDAQGNATPGVAKTWELSSDGLVYTFYLRNDAVWYLNSSAEKLAGKSFDSRVTAKDFVFALRRVADPTTKAPYFHAISAIKNADKIQRGKAAVSTLGVQALDDWTLRITLERPDGAFLKTTAAPVMFPCNQVFFELTQGRYGLELPYFISNGPFYVNTWENDTIRLPANKYYIGDNVAVPSSVAFKVNTNRSDIAAKLLDGTYDAAAVSGAESNDLQKNSKVGLFPCQNSVYGFFINCKDPYLSNLNLRYALSQAFSRELAELPSYANKATGLVPSFGKAGTVSYREAAGAVGNWAPNTIRAQEYWSKGLEQLKEDSLTLKIACTPDKETLVKKLLQSVQGNIGLSVSLSLEVMEESALKSAVRNGNYQIAFAGLTMNSDSVYDFLAKFLSSSQENPVRMNSTEYDTALKAVLNSRTETEEIENLKKAERLLLSTYAVYPVYFENSYFATAPNVTNVKFLNAGASVNFIAAERKD